MCVCVQIHYCGTRPITTSLAKYAFSPPPRPSAHTAVHICKLCKFCTFSYFQLQNISKSNIAQVDTRVCLKQEERKMFALMSSYCHLSGQCNYFTWTTRPSTPCTQCTISLSTVCTVCIAHTVTYCALPRIQSNWLGGWGEVGGNH